IRWNVGNPWMGIRTPALDERSREDRPGRANKTRIPLITDDRDRKSRIDGFKDETTGTNAG
ncbi:MAG TPA: hypothetical protein PLD79_07895, partial [Halothiobacillus sp.]|nr:hypothetical protein [Halothiobacillus sp.]